MSKISYNTVFNPTEEEIEIIEDGLDEYNIPIVGEYEYSKIAVFARDNKNNIIGGVYGMVDWGWLEILLLWVDKKYRSLDIGSRLLKAIEKEAKARNTYRYLTRTAGFQALPFYQKNGYEIWSHLDDYPPGHKAHFLIKKDV